MVLGPLSLELKIHGFQVNCVNNLTDLPLFYFFYLNIYFELELPVAACGGTLTTRCGISE